MKELMHSRDDQNVFSFERVLDAGIYYARHGMNLYLLRQINADDFYEQSWYLGEPFMQEEPERELPIPEGFVSVNEWHPYVISKPEELPSVIEYALLYIAHPELEIWEKFLWTRDTDRLGQRIYVGGVNQGKTKGFQIHRHLHIDDKWGIPLWP